MPTNKIKFQDNDEVSTLVRYKQVTLGFHHHFQQEGTVIHRLANFSEYPATLYTTIIMYSCIWNLFKVQRKCTLTENIYSYLFEKKLNLDFVSLRNCVLWIFTFTMVVLSLRVLFTVVKCLHVRARAKLHPKCVWVFWQLRNTYM